MKGWNLQTLPWEQFDASKVEPYLLAHAKSASLVESNAADYVLYLRQVFEEDPKILNEIHAWGEEEKLHGAALRRWCELADPAFDFSSAMRRFQKSFRVQLIAPSSIRGSRARELIARCVVETGTTTFYSAMRDACEEPLLREICRRIAGDEVRHFHLFLKHLNEKYADGEGIGLLGRCKTILQRIFEVDDPELTFAYMAANSDGDLDPSRTAQYSRSYMLEVVRLYQPKHFELSIPMLARAANVRATRRMSFVLAKAVHWLFKSKCNSN